nr:hypothetical protein [Tanacetum cinerariifolium]
MRNNVTPPDTYSVQAPSGGVTAIATVTTVTATVDADRTTDRVPVGPCLFGVGSSLTGRTYSVPGGFSDVFGSDFLIGGIRTVVDRDSDLQKVYVSQWSATNGFGLDDSRICSEITMMTCHPPIRPAATCTVPRIQIIGLRGCDMWDGEALSHGVLGGCFGTVLVV